jgi:hypothetical protein
LRGRILQNLTNKKTKLYTFEIDCQILASANRRYLIGNEVFWPFLARFRMTIWQCKVSVNPGFWSENGGALRELHRKGLVK